jgi:hypothetical protein
MNIRKNHRFSEHKKTLVRIVKTPLMTFESFKRFIKNIVTNSTIMALVGVICGGLITGYFTYITQKSILDNQEEQFKTQYRIERNKQLRTELSAFVNDISDVINIPMDTEDRDKVFAKMMSSSVRIILLEDAEIGQQCLSLTTELKAILDRKTPADNSKFYELVSNWIISIKAQMKLIDYSVDDKSIQSDILSLWLNSNLKDK